MLLIILKCNISVFSHFYSFISRIKMTEEERYFPIPAGGIEPCDKSEHKWLNYP